MLFFDEFVQVDKITKKNGFFRGKQRYKCHVCSRQFSSRDEISLEEVWHLYSSGKQTYNQLAAQFCCSTALYFCIFQ